jgi:hypothetical protein
MQPKKIKKRALPKSLQKVAAKNQNRKMVHSVFIVLNPMEILSKAKGWIQCSRCRQWAHDACAGIDENAWDDFICDLCLTNSSHNANSSKRLLKF